ncbi:MAG: hypothetical protein ACLFRD_01605, partial [Nitriliruptoraceae bacterium]
MNRTLRASLLALLIVLLSVGGLGTFLGFDPVASVLTGAVLGALAAALLYGASRRADTFHPADHLDVRLPDEPEERDAREDPDDPVDPVDPVDPG